MCRNITNFFLEQQFTAGACHVFSTNEYVGSAALSVKVDKEYLFAGKLREPASAEDRKGCLAHASLLVSKSDHCCHSEIPSDRV